MRQSAAFVRGFLLFHIAVAVATFGAWGTIAWLSWKKFRGSLPGRFTRRHVFRGKAAFVGLCLTSTTGAALYAMLFIA